MAAKRVRRTHPVDDEDERRALVAERRRQERGPGDGKAPRLAPTYLHATHPVHGEPVVFLPGEALPDWLWDAADTGEDG